MSEPEINTNKDVLDEDRTWMCDRCRSVFYKDAFPHHWRLESQPNKKFCEQCFYAQTRSLRDRQITTMNETPVTTAAIERIECKERASIDNHEGKKYLRKIKSAKTKEVIEVDVYAVLTAFGVDSHAVAHAIKKLLCTGQRGKGDRKADLIGAIAAINRAIDDLEDEE